MRQRLAFTFGVLAMGWLARGTVRAEDAVFYQAPGTAVQAVLTPVNPEQAGFTSAVAADPPVPPIFTGDLRVDFGFEYLQPHFRDSSVSLTVPAGADGNVARLGGRTNLSHSFAFVPRISFDYQFADLGFGVGASGKLINLTGHLERTVNSTAGSADLNARSSVDIAVANFLEATKVFSLESCPCLQDTELKHGLVLATIGPRYSYIHQTYVANLASGPILSSLDAHQDFNGFGLTTSVNTLFPVGSTNVFWYTSSRGSFLVGQNNRSSTSTVNPGSGTGVSTTLATENKTDFIPVGEFEAGLAWGTALVGPRATAAAAQTAPILWIKGGPIAQIWGDLGLLSGNSLQPFSNGNLLLYGFSVMVGLDW